MPRPEGPRAADAKAADELPPGKRRCSKCGQPKRLDEFVQDCGSKSGRRAHCRVCANAYYHAWRARDAAGNLPHVALIANRRTSVISRNEHVITVAELELCLPGGMTGRVVGHWVRGRIVYDASK